MAYQLAAFYFAAFIANGLFLAGSAFVATRFRVQIERVKLGTGPQLFARGKFTLAPLPFSAFVRMLDTRETSEDVDRELAYDCQSRLVRVAIALSGPLALLLGAIALRGTTGWKSFLFAFGQILSGAIAPATRGVELASGYMQAAESGGFVTALGVVLSKMAAINLLPVPSLGGGMALCELLQPSARSPAYDKAVMAFQHIGLVALLLLLLPWMYAVVTAGMAR